MSNYCLKKVVWGNQGPVNAYHIDAYLKLLNSVTDGKGKMSFTPFLVSYAVEDGVCSAYCLSFLSVFLRSQLAEHLYQLHTKGPLFEDLQDRVVQSFQNCPTDTQIRTYQAALNTIYPDHKCGLSVDELLEEKIKALCQLKNLKVLSSSKNNVDFYNRPEESNMGNFIDSVNSLNSGSYLIRAIQEAPNYKGENYGHSMAFIKDESGCYFFDPSSAGGLLHLNSEDASELLYDLVRHLCLHYNLNFPRIYKVVDKENLYHSET